MKLMSRLLMAFIIFLVLGTPVHAVLTIVDSRSSVEGVLGPHEVITFEEFSDGPIASCTPTFPFKPDPCLITTQGITFTTTAGFPQGNLRPVLAISSNDLVAPSKVLRSNSQIPIRPDQFFLTFSHTLQGIGLDIVGFGSIPGVPVSTVWHIVVTETDGSVTEIPISNSAGLAFFGVTSDVGITKVSLFDPVSDGSSFFFGISNIVFPPLTVPIDILTNGINLKSRGVIPVAILSSPSFDAPTQIDPDTLTLAGATVKTPGKSGKLLCETDDVNNDGLLDRVCGFSTEQLVIQPEDSTVVLEGQTFDGTPIRGESSVTTR